MSTESFWVCDPYNNEYEEYGSLELALECGQVWLKDYKDNCDPEWPEGVEYLVIVKGTPDKGSDKRIEDQLLVVAKIVEFDRVELDEEEAEACGCDYMCDYRFEIIP